MKREPLNPLNTFSHYEYGDVEVRPAMFDVDGTTLEEGIEIVFLEEDLPTIEIYGKFNLDEFTADEVYDIIDDHIDFNQHFN